MGPRRLRVLMRLAGPGLVFELCRRKERRVLIALLRADPCYVAAMRRDGPGGRPEGVLSWVCRQRGVTHRIAREMLQNGPFDREARGRAVRAARGVRNKRTLGVLLGGAC